MGDFLSEKKKIDQLRNAYLRYNFGEIKYNADSKVYASVKGMPFRPWIDLTGRTNSFNEGDLIENIVYQIESVIRDVILCEYDLEASGYSIGYISFNSTHGLISTADNYYKDAYLINVTKGWIKKVDSYVGSTKRCNISTVDTVDIGYTDKLYMTNIQGNNLIDTDYFDACATIKTNWKGRINLDSQIEAYTFLDNIAFEAQCSLYKAYGKYRIMPIETGTSDGTLSSPLIEKGGNLLCDAALSDVDDIFTSFIVNYNYLPQENKYSKTLTCNKNETNSTSLTSYKTYCENAEVNYRVSRELEIDLNFIHDETTALAFIQRIIKEKTFQRLVVGYIGDVKDHIKYEKGDLVKINVPTRMPTSKNNSAQFLITKQDISFKEGLGEVTFKLVEMI